ncbi:hypothetical protein GEMRC1_013692 [Eukaryota sp. GEM-RC1]
MFKWSNSSQYLKYSLRCLQQSWNLKQCQSNDVIDCLKIIDINLLTADEVQTFIIHSFKDLESEITDILPQHRSPTQVQPCPTSIPLPTSSPVELASPQWKKTDRKYDNPAWKVVTVRKRLGKKNPDFKCDACGHVLSSANITQMRNHHLIKCEKMQGSDVLQEILHFSKSSGKKTPRAGKNCEKNLTSLSIEPSLNVNDPNVFFGGASYFKDYYDSYLVFVERILIIIDVGADLIKSQELIKMIQKSLQILIVITHFHKDHTDGLMNLVQLILSEDKNFLCILPPWSNIFGLEAHVYDRLVDKPDLLELLYSRSFCPMSGCPSIHTQKKEVSSDFFLFKMDLVENVSMNIFSRKDFIETDQNLNSMAILLNYYGRESLLLEICFFKKMALNF